MVQDQLLDYISSQMKLGVSRDAIKSALVSAGWVAADVEDTLKKLEGSGAAAVAAQSAQPAASSMSTKPMGSVASSSQSPQMIRVSDLVSGAKPVMTTNTTAAATGASTNTTKNDTSKFAGKISGNSFEAASPMSSSGSSGGKRGLIFGVIAAVIILALAGLSWYFYSGNTTLAGQVSALTAQSTQLNTQITSLQSELEASSTGFASQILSLTNANADLALNLSFYAAPIDGTSSSSSSSTSPAPSPVTISGWLSGGGKAPYVITTPRGAKVFVANSSDAKLSSELKPIVGHTIQALGTYIPGSDQITVNSVTDLSPAAPVAPTSTAASSTPAAAPAPASGASSTATSTSK